MMTESARLEESMMAAFNSNTPEALLRFRYDDVNRRQIDAAEIDVAVAVAA
jgi:hypothetical protein